MVGATPEVQLGPGIAVAIHGLKAADLNGKEGKCKEWDSSKGRWTVEMRGGELKSIKPENLRPTTQGIQHWAIGGAVIGLFVAMLLSGSFSGLGVESPASYVKELMEPFDPPPPKAPKDTVVISFCQG
jgi:hypothetical protein